MLLYYWHNQHQIVPMQFLTHQGQQIILAKCHLESWCLHILVSWCLLMSLLEYAVCIFCGHQNDSAYSWMVVSILKNWCWSRMTLIHGPHHLIGVQPTAFMGLSECRSMSDLCILNDYGILNNPVLKSMNPSSMLCRLIIWHSIIGPHPRSFSSMTVIRP